MEQSHRTSVGWVCIVLATMAEYTDASVNKEQTEADQYVIEAFDNGNAQQDEDEAHNQRAENAPKQCAVLILARNFEVREDHCPDEDVVDAQALFNEITTDVLDCGCSLKHPPNNKSKAEADSDPYGGFDCCFLDMSDVWPTMHNQNVEQQERANDAKQHVPTPWGNGDIDEIISSTTCCHEIEHV
jgi:hypothetical protein